MNLNPSSFPWSSLTCLILGLLSFLVGDCTWLQTSIFNLSPHSILCVSTSVCECRCVCVTAQVWRVQMCQQHRWGQKPTSDAGLSATLFWDRVYLLVFYCVYQGIWPMSFQEVPFLHLPLPHSNVGIADTHTTHLAFVWALGDFELRFFTLAVLIPTKTSSLPLHSVSLKVTFGHIASIITARSFKG